MFRLEIEIYPDEISYEVELYYRRIGINQPTGEELILEANRRGEHPLIRCSYKGLCSFISRSKNFDLVYSQIEGTLKLHILKDMAKDNPSINKFIDYLFDQGVYNG